MCSQTNQFPGQFLLIDNGHPVAQTDISLVKKSLLNILSLASCLKGASRIPVFGCGILESYLNVVQELDFLMGNYAEIEKNLENIEHSTQIGVKCKLKDYKALLGTSILRILNDFQSKRKNWKLKTSVKDQFNRRQYWPTKIQITLITKKSALPIQKMLEDVDLYASCLKKIEIIEIFGSEDDKLDIMAENTQFISCSFVSANICDLEAIFKKWIVADECEREQLRITLNEESGLHLKCVIEDCIINPENLDISKHSFQPDINISTCEMDVINKLEISNVCTSKLFGFPKIIYTSRSYNLTKDEIQYNDQLFKALCIQLFQEEIGLLTKIKPKFNGFTAFYFIISDGEKLLMQNVIPMELQLPFGPEPLKTTVPDNEQVNFAVRTLLDRLQTVENISPHKYSSGIYEYLKKHIKSKERDNILKFECFQNAKWRKIKEMTSFSKISFLPGEYVPKALKDFDSLHNKFSQRKRAIKNLRKYPGKNSKEKKNPIEEVIHPALLPPELIARYRKFNCHKFLLPELLVPGVVEK